MISIEKWKKVFENKIPKSQYEMLLQSGEEEGLLIRLISRKNNVLLKFGAVSAFRMLEEGIALNGLFNDEQLKQFRDTGFDNVIYQVTGGNFDTLIQQIGGGLYEYLNMKHYVIITKNYIVEVITEWEPEIQFF